MCVSKHINFSLCTSTVIHNKQCNDTLSEGVDNVDGIEIIIYRSYNTIKSGCGKAFPGAAQLYVVSSDGRVVRKSE